MSGPLPERLRFLAIPMAWAYGIGVRVRNARFDAGSGVRELSVPLISIGNITAGGTGKTPFVAWTAAALRQRGHHPVIGMRGYGAAPGERGDEELEYAAILPQVPVVAHPDRHAALTRYLTTRSGRPADAPSPDCVILDDGFQHRQLRRDLDIVLIDAQRPGLDGRLLPSGWLREPASGLRRASAVVVTRSDRPSMRALSESIARIHGKAPIAWTQHAWRRLDRHGEGVEDSLPVSWLRGKRITLLAGVGNPGSVRRAAEAEGATVAGEVSVPDHVQVTETLVRRAIGASEGSDALLVTRKDWVKLARHFASVGGLPRDAPPWIVPDLAIEFVEGPDGTMGDERMLALLRAAIARPASVSGVGSPAAMSAIVKATASVNK